LKPTKESVIGIPLISNELILNEFIIEKKSVKLIFLMHNFITYNNYYLK